MACNTPGTKNNKDKIILMTKSFPTPDLMKTATGGSNIAIIIWTNLFIVAPYINYFSCP
jgi:hypothetical protein